MSSDELLRLSLIIFGIFGAVRYVFLGLRASVPDPCEDRFSQAANARDRGATGVPDFVVAGLFFATTCAMLIHPFPAAVVYAILCLVLAVRLVAGLLFEEHERAQRRRAALLQRSPRIDGALAVWIGLAVTSTLLLIPSLLAGSNEISALVVAGCCLTMASVAWRIATAPPLLSGDDVEAELLLDRTRRIRRTGLVCMIAVGSVFYFAAVTGAQPNITFTGILAWVVLGVWLIVYLRRLYRMPLPSRARGKSRTL